VCLTLFGQWQSVLQIFVKIMGQPCPTQEASGTLFAPCSAPPCPTQEASGTLFGTLFGPVFSSAGLWFEGDGGEPKSGIKFR
jgi:hypothetical protein